MKKHYQIIIVACCFLIMFVNQGLPSTSFNVWQPYLQKLPTVGDGGVTTVLTTRTLVSFLSIFLVTKYYKLFDLRIGIALATLFTIGGFVSFGFADGNMVLLILGSILAGVGYGLGGSVATTALIGKWFTGDVGTAAGISGVGSGTAGMLIPLIVSQIEHHFSLSTAFFSVASLALIFGLITFMLVRSQPSDMGLKPFVGKKKVHTGKLAKMEAKAQASEAPASISKLSRVLVLVAMALLGADAIAANNYFSLNLTTSGIDVMTAAALTSLMGASLTISKFLSGKLFDIIGTYISSILFFAALVLGCALLAFVSDGGMLFAVVGAIGFGAGCALSTTGLSVWSIEVSEPGEKLKAARNFMIAYSFGGFAFNMLPGFMKGFTGTYESSFIVFAIGSLACMLLVLYVLKSRKRTTQTTSVNTSDIKKK